MILTLLQVEEGEKVPWGYGFAWRDFSTKCWFAYPIPFNVLFREFRRLWHWIIGGDKSSAIDRAELRGYHRACSEHGLSPRLEVIQLKNKEELG